MTDAVGHDTPSRTVRLSILALSLVVLNVNLPYLYYGDADLLSDSLSVSLEGWVQGALESSFYTEDAEGEPPEFFIDVYSEVILANLTKAPSS